jgi:hypothetical protein
VEFGTSVELGRRRLRAGMSDVSGGEADEASRLT